MPATTTRASDRAPLALFAKNFFRHPRMLGSIIPSSRFLIRRLLREADWQQVRTVVEYGPGVGTITRAVLDRLRPDGRMVVIDTNLDFVAYLQSELRDPRLHVVHGSAAEVEEILRRLGLDGADVAISGIPMSTLPPGVRSEVLDATRRVLRPGGIFLVYQFSPTVGAHLQRVFANVRRSFEPLNVLPASLYFCTVEV
jgi:phospholipid N-methyltransferase